MKQTIEEAAKDNFNKKTEKLPVPTSLWVDSEFLQIQSFKEGATWQKEHLLPIIGSHAELLAVLKEAVNFIQDDELSRCINEKIESAISKAQLLINK